MVKTRALDTLPGCGKIRCEGGVTLPESAEKWSISSETSAQFLESLTSITVTDISDLTSHCDLNSITAESF